VFTCHVKESLHLLAAPVLNVLRAGGYPPIHSAHKLADPSGWISLDQPLALVEVENTPQNRQAVSDRLRRKAVSELGPNEVEQICLS
jgi:hypothetical protein